MASGDTNDTSKVCMSLPSVLFARLLRRGRHESNDGSVDFEEVTLGDTAAGRRLASLLRESDGAPRRLSRMIIDAS